MKSPHPNKEAKYRWGRIGDFRPILRYISETVQDRRDVVTTNQSFRTAFTFLLSYSVFAVIFLIFFRFCAVR